MNATLLASPSQRSGIIVLTNEPPRISADATPADASAIIPCVVFIAVAAVATACSSISMAYTDPVLALLAALPTCDCTGTAGPRPALGRPRVKRQGDRGGHCHGSDRFRARQATRPLDSRTR